MERAVKGARPRKRKKKGIGYSGEVKQVHSASRGFPRSSLSGRVYAEASGGKRRQGVAVLPVLMLPLVLIDCRKKIEGSGRKERKDRARLMALLFVGPVAITRGTDLRV